MNNLIIYQNHLNRKVDDHLVICRIGSLEILTGKAPTKELVICRIGSLEIFLVKILNSK